VSTVELDQLREALIARIPWLRKHIDRRIPDRFRSVISADDILQETWIAANRGAATFVDERPDAIDRWLMTIANSRLIDGLRAVRTVKRGAVARVARRGERQMTSLCDLLDRVKSPLRTPSSESARLEAAHAVGITLTRLPADYRRVIRLKYFEGLTNEQVARRMGKTTDSIRNIAYRGLLQLRDALGSAARYLSDANSSDLQGERSPNHAR
jgi:RNA polymerase sigma-70 factor (ECF subfamily)